MNGIKFKIASEPREFEQIHRLNYKTFVEEIPQHAPNPTYSLIDRFHDENTYVICLCGNQLIGMLAIRGKRPFSLDSKIDDLDSYLPDGQRICEIRLLTVAPKYRTSTIFVGLAGAAAMQCRVHDYNLAVISGTVRQQRLYRHLGFLPFGPLVGTPQALF